jgi:branched-chain amino acid transport system ATP-binding protein
MILEVNKINTFYGSSHILFDVSLEVDEGEVVGILGRNGAGKTTTLKSIMGLTPVRSGSIRFHGENIKGKPPFHIARLGIGFVPEDRIIFPDLSVLENLQMGIKRGAEPRFEEIYQLFPILKERKNQQAGVFSGGEQQMLTIARTLMGRPDFLLVDEPSEGLAPKVVAALKEQMQYLKNTGITILLCEQNLNFVLELADRCYIIEKGQIRWGGTAPGLKARPDLLKQYLGV